jgi:hypothetical protein
MDVVNSFVQKHSEKYSKVMQQIDGIDKKIKMYEKGGQFDLYKAIERSRKIAKNLYDKKEKNYNELKKQEENKRAGMKINTLQNKDIIDNLEKLNDSLNEKAMEDSTEINSILQVQEDKDNVTNKRGGFGSFFGSGSDGFGGGSFFSSGSGGLFGGESSKDSKYDESSNKGNRGSILKNINIFDIDNNKLFYVKSGSGEKKELNIKDLESLVNSISNEKDKTDILDNIKRLRESPSLEKNTNIQNIQDIINKHKANSNFNSFVGGKKNRRRLRTLKKK